MLQLRLQLCSDATFGSGEGVAGQLDNEVEHDAHGFPRVRGRTIKGLLVENCADILWSLQCQSEDGLLPSEGGSLSGALSDYRKAAHFLFGAPGSHLRARARLHIGPAQFPAALRTAVARDILDKKLTPTDVLNSLTAIRRQSAVDEHSGAPDHGSLRSARVLLRHTRLESDLTFDVPPDATARALLAACVQALRRGGMARNRGRGRLQCGLFESGCEVTTEYFATFLPIGGGVGGGA